MKELKIVYIMWLRDMKRFVRSPSRIAGSIVIPFLLLVSIGAGFGKMAIPGITDKSVTYLGYLVPGMVGMSILFSGIFAGFSVLWDRQYGFLKEIMVAPVSRISVVLGRIASGSTMGIFQSIMLVLVSQTLGFKILSIFSLLSAILMMIMISVSFTGIGLIFASRMKDEQGFGLIMNFLVFPMLFLSGAFAPLENLPFWVKILSYFDPLTYGIDGLRAVLLGISSLPPLVDFAVAGAIGVFFVFLGAWFFETSEVV